jgi:hypothetical protein
LGAAGLLGERAFSIVPDPNHEQYQTIPERNVFGLRPPTLQPGPTNSAAPLPKITLAGITTILDTKRALMKVAPSSNGLKPGDPAKELSLILTEGQREADIEVLLIDEKKGSVKVNNSGTVMVLTFEKDGAKLPASSQMPGTPGVPSPLPTTAASNHFAFPAPSLPGAPPSRGRRPAPTLPGVATGTASAIGGVPSPTGVSAAPSPATTASTPQDLTPEEQTIVMELQRQANVNNAALIPPTPLTAPSTQPAEATAPAVTPSIPLPGQPTNIVPQ